MPDPERAPIIARAFEELATGRVTKQEVIARMTEAGLRTRRGSVLSPQSFGQMVRNSIYIGKVESPDYGVSTRGDFEPLVDEDTFCRVQAVLDGRVVVSGPRPRNHPDSPLRIPIWAVAAFVGGIIGSELGSRWIGTPAFRVALALVLVIAGGKLILAR